VESIHVQLAHEGSVVVMLEQLGDERPRKLVLV
jgi:hypothetical protein